MEQVEQVEQMNELETTFRVGRRYRCHIQLALPIGRRGKVGSLKVEWDDVPRRRLSRAELRDYRRGRNQLFSEAARLTGQRLMVADVLPGGGLKTTVIEPAAEEGTHGA